MADNETPRFKIPFPKENAESWFDTFKDTMYNLDARIFENLEHLQLINVQLPEVEIRDMGAGVYHFIPRDVAKFLSRTHHVEIEVTSRFVVLEPGSIIGAWLQSGAVGPQSVEWEVWNDRMEVDATAVPMGYVNDDHTIIWFNGAYIEVGQTKRLFDFTGASGYVQGKGNYYVDAVNGSDTIGDGTPGAPWKTLVHASTAVPAPVTAEDWFYLAFHLAPGTYAGNFTLPDRLRTLIIGEAYIILGDIDWAIEPKSWDDWGALPSAQNPALSFIGESIAYSTDDRSGLCFVLGQVKAYNVSPGGGYDMPESKVLNTRDVVMVGRIWNAACGATVKADATGTMNIRIEGCEYEQSAVGYTPPYTPCIFGEAEPVSGVDWMPNPVTLSGIDTNIKWGIYGCARFNNLDNVSFREIDWSLDKDGNPYPQGWMDGGSFGLRNCTGKGTQMHFGYDGGVTDPLAQIPQAVYFDSTTWCWITSSGMPTFSNFDPASTPGARGYLFVDCAGGTKVDASGFSGNLGPTDDDVQTALATLDAMTPSGSPIPSWYVYVDIVNGSDVSPAGDGTIQKPWKTLAHAVTQVPTTSIGEYNTPVVFMMAPGAYNHSVSDPGGILMPYRQAVSVVGVDVTITGNINFYQTPSAVWWPPGANAGLYFGSPSAPTFFINGDIHCKVTTPDHGTTVGQRGLALDKAVLSGAVLNQDSGATVSGEGTGPLYLTSLHAQMTSSDKSIFGEAETGTGSPLAVADQNEIVLLAYDSFIQNRILGFIKFRNMHNCWFTGRIRYDQTPAAMPYPGRVEGLADKSFLDCVFNDPGGFAFGDGGVGLTGSPQRLFLDSNSFKSLKSQTYTFDGYGASIEDGYVLIDHAEAEAVETSGFTGNLLPAGPHDNDTVQKCLATLDTMSGAAIPRIQLGMAGAVGIDLFGYTSGAPLVMTWNLQDFKDDPPFTHNVGVNADKITLAVTGQYAVSFGINWDNADPGQPKCVGVAVRLSPGGGGPVIMERTRSYATVVDAQNARATNQLSEYEFSANAGDVIDVIIWLDGSPGIVANTNLRPDTSWLRIEKR